tara:strand:+ start:719 stop:820 length:102 start_codon:yes stop_codon:yes gene_type:complete
LKTIVKELMLFSKLNYLRGLEVSELEESDMPMV